MTAQLKAHLECDLRRYSVRIVQRGLVVGPGGNISVRDGALMWISPSGYALNDIPAERWVAVDIASGQPQRTSLRPSSESAMHLAIYRERADVDAVVHTHPPTTVGIISAGYDEIPFMFPDQVALVGKTSCIDYVTPCSVELADAVVAKLRAPSCHALLMKNHGLITVGSTMKEAYYRTEVVEDAAKVFWIAKAVGTPRHLSECEAEEILDLEAEKYRQQLLRDIERPL